MSHQEALAAIQYRGTPEVGYTDSGLWKFLNYVYTKDSHEKKNPVKKMPVGEKDFLKVLFLFMLCCDKLAVPKSRQMMVSWALSAYDVWHAMSAPYRHVIYQTKKEDDAKAMVTEGRKNPRGGRMDFIIHNLPEWLRDDNIVGGTGNLVGNLVFNPERTSDSGDYVPWHGSRIEAVPGGADQVRGKTPSKISIDEGAFHDELAKVIVACNPAVAGGGQLHIISSVDAGSDFNQLVLETEDGGPPEQMYHPTVMNALEIMGIRWPKGLKSWKTKSGFWVLELHYCSDPAKDPERDGAAWLDEAVKGYPGGGMDSRGWKTEMEIDYEAGGGEKVFPFLTSAINPIFIPRIDPRDAMNRMNVFAGYDYGTNNPSAFVVWGIDEQARLFALWELYEPCLDFAQHCNRIKRCPYYERLEYIVADNKIFSKTQQSASGLQSIAELFHAEQIHLRRARQGMDYPMALRFLGDYWQDPQKPKAFITEDCPNGKMEVRGLRFAEHVSSVVASRKNNAEKLVDKNNHWWDASAYALDQQPTSWRPQAEAVDPQSFNAFLARAGMIGEQEAPRRGGIRVS